MDQTGSVEKRKKNLHKIDRGRSGGETVFDSEG